MRRPYVGGCNPGERSHPSIWEPASHWRALRNSVSRSAPGCSNFACARRLAASSISRSESIFVCLKRRRIFMARSLSVRGRRERNWRSHTDISRGPFRDAGRMNPFHVGFCLFVHIPKINFSTRRSDSRRHPLGALIRDGLAELPACFAEPFGIPAQDAISKEAAGQDGVTAPPRAASASAWLSCCR